MRWRERKKALTVILTSLRMRLPTRWMSQGSRESAGEDRRKTRRMTQRRTKLMKLRTKKRFR